MRLAASCRLPFKSAHIACFSPVEKHARFGENGCAVSNGNLYHRCLITHCESRPTLTFAACSASYCLGPSVPLKPSVPSKKSLAFALCTDSRDLSDAQGFWSPNRESRKSCSSRKKRLATLFGHLPTWPRSSDTTKLDPRMVGEMTSTPFVPSLMPDTAHIGRCVFAKRPRWIPSQLAQWRTDRLHRSWPEYPVNTCGGQNPPTLSGHSSPRNGVTSLPIRHMRTKKNRREIFPRGGMESEYSPPSFLECRRSSNARLIKVPFTPPEAKTFAKRDALPMPSSGNPLVTIRVIRTPRFDCAKKSDNTRYLTGTGRGSLMTFACCRFRNRCKSVGKDVCSSDAPRTNTPTRNQAANRLRGRLPCSAS